MLKSKLSRYSPAGARKDFRKADKKPNKRRTKAEQKPNKGRIKAEQSPRELQKHPKSRQEAILERCLQQPCARHAHRASRKRFGDDVETSGPSKFLKWRRTVIEIKAFPFFTGGRQKGLPEGRQKAEQKPNKGRTKAEQSPRELQKHPKSRQEAILERCLQQPRARHARRASRKRFGDDF